MRRSGVSFDIVPSGAPGKHRAAPQVCGAMAFSTVSGLIRKAERESGAVERGGKYEYTTQSLGLTLESIFPECVAKGSRL